MKYMKNTKNISASISPESIKQLSELSEKFHQSKSAIIDGLVRATMSQDDAEKLFYDTVLKLIKLQKTFES